METPRDFCEPNVDLGWGGVVEIMGSLSSLALVLAAVTAYFGTSGEYFSRKLLCATCLSIGAGSLLYHANVTSHQFMLLDAGSMLLFVTFVNLVTIHRVNALRVRSYPKSACALVFVIRTGIVVGFVFAMRSLVLEGNGVTFDVAFGSGSVLIVIIFIATPYVVETMEVEDRKFLRKFTLISAIVIIIGLSAWQLAEKIVCPKLSQSETAIRYITGGGLHLLWHFCVAYAAYVVIMGCEVLSCYAVQKSPPSVDYYDRGCCRIFPTVKVHVYSLPRPGCST